MRDIFNLDGPVFEALNRLADMVILNLLFLLCCVPVITIGASLTALSCVTLKMKDKEEGYVARTFFRSFRQNFRQATVIWLILLMAAAVMGVDFRILNSLSGVPMLIVRTVVIIGAMIWCMIFFYVFPLLAKFENTITATLKNALLLSLANFPKAILIIVITVGAVILTMWSQMTLVYGILVWLLIGFALLSWINSTLQIRILHQLIPEEKEDPETEYSEETAFSTETDIAEEMTVSDGPAVSGTAETPEE